MALLRDSPYAGKTVLLPQVRTIDAFAGTDTVEEAAILPEGSLCRDRDRDRLAGQLERRGVSLHDITHTERSGLVVGTALVDLHSTSGAPGREPRETLDSLAAAAWNGGFVQVGILPAVDPPIDDSAAIAFWQQQPHRTLQPWGAITKGCEGQQLAELAELAPHVLGFTDGQALSNLVLLRRVMEYVRPLSKPLMLWPYRTDLGNQGSARESAKTLQLGLSGIPAAAETAALAATLELVALTRTPTHFMRISVARSVELLRRAKAEGLPVTASTTWMHLWQEDADLATYDPNLHLDPPLGTADDRLALIEGVRDGTLDAIAIDHTPYTYEEKMVAFEASPSGAIGLEFALPVLWQRLVASGTLSALDLWRALSANPARCLGIKRSPAWVLFDPDRMWVADGNALASRSRNSICVGQSIVGRVLGIFSETNSKDGCP